MSDMPRNLQCSGNENARESYHNDRSKVTVVTHLLTIGRLAHPYGIVIFLNAVSPVGFRAFAW